MRSKAQWAEIKGQEDIDFIIVEPRNSGKFGHQEFFRYILRAFPLFCRFNS